MTETKHHELDEERPLASLVYTFGGSSSRGRRRGARSHAAEVPKSLATRSGWSTVGRVHASTRTQSIPYWTSRRSFDEVPCVPL
jgi:hypothetical protein